MRIDLTVQYQCGCTETVRTDVNLPADLACAERSPETDRRIIDYIIANYTVEKWRCPTGHGIGVPCGFRKILSIDN